MLGWYAYAFAAEPFVVCAVATYVPLLLEGLARDNAVLADDRRAPCRVAGDIPGLLPAPIAPPKCVVKLGPMWIDTASLPLYTFAVSVAVQTVVVVSISGVADRGHRRKQLLIGFAVLGSVATISLAWVSRVHYYTASALAVVANASFGAVTVCGNAYLPSLVAGECRRLATLRRTAADRFSNAFPQETNHIEAARIGARISGRGSATGYAAALFVQLVTMTLLLEAGSSAERASSRLRLVIMLIGWWWLLGQILVFWFLPTDATEYSNQFANEFIEHTYTDVVHTSTGSVRTRCGEEEIDPIGHEIDAIGPAPEYEETSILQDIWSGWAGLFATIRHTRQLQDITTFLIGWFLLSDAVTTINSTAVLFARTNLAMATPALALIGLITVVFAICGSLVFARQQNQAKSLVTIALIGALIPTYGVLGFFQPYIGLKHQWELFLLSAWYGFALGALNAVIRSMYSMLIPQGHEVMFFALYAVTDKGSSILGPTVTGFITDRTHNIRYTFYFLLGMMLMAAFVFSHVDYVRGQQEARAVEEDRTTSEH